MREDRLKYKSGIASLPESAVRHGQLTQQEKLAYKKWKRTGDEKDKSVWEVAKAALNNYGK